MPHVQTCAGGPPERTTTATDLSGNSLASGFAELNQFRMSPIRRLDPPCSTMDDQIYTQSTLLLLALLDRQSLMKNLASACASKLGP